MAGLSIKIPDLEDRIFTVKLSRQITAQDMEELKYVLASPIIPDGKMETLNTPLKLFYYLKNLQFVGPNNLENMEELFRRLENPTLYQMITNFTRDRDNQTVGPFPRFVAGELWRLPSWFLILFEDINWRQNEK